MVAVIIMGAFVVIGVLYLLGMIIKRLKCSEEVEATVAELIPNNDSDSGTACYPVFLYWYEGAEYRRKSGFSSLFLKFKEGQQVTLFIDPNKPDRIWFPRETIHKVITIVCFTASSALIMMGFYLSYKKGQ
ncbi:DUF3592 domain-containing protein [Ruminococcus sp.]|uniref:DUF3592 domain-containing protein n=1 Tax=Ruminococcus sp. TaxID=41978 RepID=UPI003452AF00